MFNEKTIVITGGSSGLGKELAQRFAKRGANIALVARDETKLRTVQSSLMQVLKEGRRAEIFSCDVSDADAVEKTMQSIVNTMGMPDMLINSAGILRESHFEKQSLETFREVMDINFFGTLHCIKAVLPFFRQKGGGRIVIVCSMAGLLGVFGYASYCASKHALSGLASTIRSELKPHNIIVQIVYPPEFESPMVDELNTYRSEENRTIVQTIPVLDIDVVADAVIEGMEKNKYEIIPGLTAKIMARIDRWFPALSRAVIDFQIKKFFRGKNK